MTEPHCPHRWRVTYQPTTCQNCGEHNLPFPVPRAVPDSVDLGPQS